jgi:hypothetical protein
MTPRQHTIPMETCALCLSRRLDRLERQFPQPVLLPPPDLVPDLDVGVHTIGLEVATKEPPERGSTG